MALRRKIGRKAKKIAVTLVGNSLLGGLHIGQLKSLSKHGLLGSRLSCVHGISSGAMTASAMSAAQHPREIDAGIKVAESSWRGIDSEGPEAVFGFGRLAARFGDMDFKSLLKVLKQKGLSLDLLKNIHWSDLKKLSGTITALRDFLAGDSLLGGGSLEKLLVGYRPELSLTSYFAFNVAVFSERNRRVETLSPQDFQDNPRLFERAVRASASLRPFFPPVEIRGVRYWDARSMCETAPGLAECDLGFVLFAHEANYVPKSHTELLYEEYGVPRFFGDWIFQEAVAAADLDKLKFEVLRNAFRERGGELIALYTSTPETLSSFSLKTGDIVHGMAMAEAAADNVLDEIC